MALRYITAETDRRMTCLVIGRAGIGKTSLLRTIPESEEVFTISAEAGLLCVRDMVESGRVQGAEVTGTADVIECLDNLRFNPKWRDRYTWVFIDSLTEISSVCYEEMKARYPDRRDSFNMWDAYAGIMNRIIKSFRDLKPYNVVFTCLAAMEFDDGKKPIVSPDVQLKSLKQRLTSFFDEVFYMTDVPAEGGEMRRMFITQPFLAFPGKDRSGRLELHEEPDLARVKAKILGA
ncbi:MAG: ATP-binding protein [Deltaproteobacteria bacterium]|jgi:hypothetical protein|nr:ATP-binding protein [Deltaproteobacteria bacterium]